MPKTRKAPTPATKPRALRSARSASKKPVGVRAPAPVPEFIAIAHHDEIAEVAYYKWLERAGSPQEDWLEAEIEVRARYAQREA